MWSSYLRIAWRNIVRQRQYSAINVIGLTVGIASCILIVLWVQNELSYDRFNTDYEDIYRICCNLTINGRTRPTPHSSMPLGTALKQEYADVESMTRIRSARRSTVKYDEREFREESILFAESSFFDVFSYPLIRGDRRAILDAPHTVVISETIARKYFDAGDPLGKSLKFSDGRSFTVTGVVRDAPSTSHLVFNFLCSLETLRAVEAAEFEQWGAIGYTTYIRLAKGTDSMGFQRKVERLVEDRIGAGLRNAGLSMVFYLQPLRQIHLYSNFEFDEARRSSIEYVYLFSGIALFILLLACINYVNLATARYAGRAMEVGLRKTMGASRGALIRQFMGETILVTAGTVFLAWIMSAAGLKHLSSITGRSFGPESLVQPWFIVCLAAFTLLVGLISGAYPALFLSSFDPVATLKGKVRTGAASSFFRNVLVAVQFSVAIALIIGTLTILEQMRFVRNKNLGFNKDLVLIASYPNKAPLSIEAVRHELASIPGVSAAAMSSDVPYEGLSMNAVLPEGSTESQRQLVQVMDVDANYLTVLGIDIAKGRNFSLQMGTDPKESALINEAAAARLGWEEPIGRTLDMPGRGPDGTPTPCKKKIVGVVRDFHTLSLHRRIEPLVITNDRDAFGMLSMKISSTDVTGTVRRIRKKWNDMFPGEIADVSFLDEAIGRQYREEERLNQIFSSFTAVAVLISCLGLFGLASFMTERRTREVGIRKVFGAPVYGIITMLSLEFLKCVLIANCLAWPLAYFGMERWLQTFAYRAQMSPWIFVASGVAAMVIALLTVSWQTIEAARKNPVESLRYE